MTRYLLLSLFFLMLTSRVLGLDVSLAPGLSTKNALLYILAGIVLIESAVARNRKVEQVGILGPFVLLFAYAAVTWLVIVLLLQIPTYNPVRTLISLKGMLLDHILLFLVFYYGVTTYKDALWLANGLIWMVLFVNIVTLVDTWNIPDLGLVIEHISGRAAGVFGNPNDLGALLAFFLPFAVVAVIVERGVKRALAVMGLLATGLLLLLTTSRGAIVATVAGSALAAVYLRQHISARTLLRAAMVTAAFCVVTVIALVVSDSTHLLESRYQESMEGGSFDRSSGRTGVWRAALDEMLGSAWTLVTGFGWDASRQSIGRRLALHSSYITYLYELGAIGLTLFLATLAGVLVAAKRAVADAVAEVTPYAIALTFGTVSLMVAMVFNDLHVISLYTWAVTGAVLRLAASSGSQVPSPRHPPVRSVS